jgi:hypothetical protein
MDYQHRIAAWVATNILAEKDVPPAFDLPAGNTLDWLRCETDEPVDDLLVGTSQNGLIFAQVKRTIRLSRAEDSLLGSVLDQFVRQFVARRGKVPGKQVWDRELDPGRDRLALITTRTSSEPIRVRLASVLTRLQNLHNNQELSDAAANSEERRVLSIVRSRVAESWRKALDTAPSETDLRQFLSLVRVYVLNVDGGDDAEREALRILRASVLGDPDQASGAWAQLIALCSDFAKNRSGGDRSDLQRALEKGEIELRGARSYQGDIERLRQYSSTTFSTLAHLAEIRVAKSVIKIHRRSTDTLKQAAEETSTVVVGEPGAGKSGALHDLVRTWAEQGRDYVFLAVDRLAAGSLSDLRVELGLDHELPHILKNWPGIHPAFLVIDALDAARGEPAAIMMRDLMRQVVQQDGRWHVVASIRKFDLRYGVEVAELFLGSPVADFQDPEFRHVRHLNVPLLSSDELDQIASQSRGLADLVRDAPSELRNLLRVPFNLRLIADLLGSGVEASQLTPIRTQLDLLDRYWFRRVIDSDGQGDARELVLTKTCQQMVQERSLRVHRSILVSAGHVDALAELLSNQVLIEWQSSADAPPDRYVLAFSHHVLFDYAVARLLFRGAGDVFVTRVVGDPDLTVVARPSLLLHFHYLWMLDARRQQFWDLVFAMLRAEGIPQIGKLIGPSVAAELAGTLVDLEPLCASLNDVNAVSYGVGEQALRHLVGALLVGAGNGQLVGPHAGPWCQLLERISGNLQSRVAYATRSLLSSICERRDELTADQLNAAGQTARRLLEFAWSQTPADRWLVIHALQCVCRTFESSPAASAGLIRRCLEPLHLSQHGFEEMPWLARESSLLVGVDPKLVGEIYRAAFGHAEPSREPTEMGTGRILALKSNRQQDYGGALYALAEAFPAFLETAPDHATLALIAATESYVAQHHSSAERGKEETFDFDGRQVRLQSDYSGIWDQGDTYRHDDAVKMLDFFEKYLTKLAEEPEASPHLHTIVEHLVSENRIAVIWRRVLMAAARGPATLGKMVLPFTWAIPMLSGFDTSTLAGEFLKAIVPLLDSGQHERIERAIMRIPDVVPPESREAGEHIRDRLLGCLEDFGPVTEEAKTLLGELRARNAVPPNEPPVRFEGWSREYGEEEFLKEQGVPVEAEPNRKIRELERPVKEFADKNLNSTPTLEEASALSVPLQMLHDAITRAENDGVHPKQRDHAWGCLAAACARIARADGISCEDSIGGFVRGVLVEASRLSQPTPDPEADARFDDHPSWSSPAPRIEAAEGLIVLSRGRDCPTPDVVEALERLIEDPVHAVRFQIVRSLNALYQTGPEIMWRMIEGSCREERSRGVLQGLLSGSLNRLAGADPDRVARLTKVIFERMGEGVGAAKVREMCIGIFTGLYIWRGQTDSRDVILGVAARPSEYREDAAHLLAHLREPITHGPTDQPDSKQDAVRERALKLFGQLLHSASDGLLEIQRRHSTESFDDWPTEEREIAQSLARLVDHAGAEVYFASGAYDESGRGQPAPKVAVSDRAARFYREAGTILDELSDVGLASLTHHLLETLQYFIPLDPRGVFIRIGRVVHAGTRGGYQYESLAADLIVKLVERYIADYRPLLREDAECRRILVEILDVFVDAGWPSARRLTYRLEEIFR